VHDITLDDLARAAAPDEAEQAFQMTEEAFRVFYETTARPLWVYLARICGDPRLADDLLQEAYYRFLRADASFDNDDHRRHYLFRIATNLVRDQRRRPRVEVSDPVRADGAADPGDLGERTATHIDVSRAMQRLKPRERSLLWLAYAQGCSHEEIAGTLGVKTTSLKALLFRARRRLAAVLRADAAVTGGRS
jgi:RNA polymerase sigma-70 factor (ECF subfamily)